MPLTPGTRLGVYEVLAPLGAGGMGEVYRARDSRLGREVAIKVLPQHLSANPEVRARFEREAKTVSSLNHPHICTLFDVGREGDTDFLVMELVEGETLAQRLTRRALPTRDVLRIGAEIAEALERAHQADVVHRDLKPGNIMLTRSGAKLMDFGLSRSPGLAGGLGTGGSLTVALTQSPTIAAPLTAEGTIVGTFQYMAPEQLEGGEADARSDLWAMGCLLYEMATGRKAFEGKSQASLIAAIIHTQPPPLTQTAPLSPPALEWLVAACLTKDPSERLQSAHDIRMQLTWLLEEGSQAGVPAQVSAKPRGPAYLTAVLAIAGWFVAAALASYMLRAGARGEGGLFFSSIAALSTERPVGVAFGPLALSPDGTRLAMLVDRGGDRISISVYDFRNGSATVLEDTKGAGFPFWSPDSRWIAFFSDGKLRKVEASGGPAQSLADALAGRGGSWGRTGVIVFAPDIRGPMMKVSENGGAPTVVTKPASEDITHRNPLFLPDGRRFLFIERRSREETVGRLMAGALDGAAPREVLEQASNVQIADGYLLFVRNQSLLAQRFDATSLSLSGPIVPVAENIAYWNPRDIGDFSAAPTGLLAFRHQAVAEGSLAWFDHDGRPLDVLGSKERLVGVIPSHDLRQVALVRPESSGLDIWLLDLRSKQRTRVTFTNTPAVMNCAFSPDGQRLAVSAENQGSGSGSSALRIQPVSGAHGVEKLLEKTDFIVQSWSPDGKVLLGHAQRPGTGFDITYVRLDDPKHEVRDLVRTQFIETTPSFSPDGAWVAYKSDESGREEVYLVDFPNAAHKVQVSRDGVRLSIDGSNGPTWSVDGREIFFRQPEGSVMAAPVARVGDAIQVGTPVRIGLSDAPVVGPFGSDGKRFLVTQVDPSAGSVPVEVVRNWSAMIARGR